MKRAIICIAIAILGISSAYFLVSSGEKPEPTPDVAATEEEAPNYRISPEEARAILDGSDAHILLDVRTPEEYAEQHISGAILIPDTELAERATLELPDKNTPILVYCRSGVRSASASAQLVAFGYANILDLGGIIDWPYDDIVTSSEAEQ